MLRVKMYSAKKLHLNTVLERQQYKEYTLSYMGAPSPNELDHIDLKVGHQESSPSNGH